MLTIVDEDGTEPNVQPATQKSVLIVLAEIVKWMRSIGMGVLFDFVWKLIFTFCAFLLFLAALSFVMATFIYSP